MAVRASENNIRFSATLCNKINVFNLGGRRRLLETQSQIFAFSEQKDGKKKSVFQADFFNGSSGGKNKQKENYMRTMTTRHELPGSSAQWAAARRKSCC